MFFLLFFFLGERKFLKGKQDASIPVAWSNKSQEAKAILFDRISLGEVVISIIASLLKFVSSLLFAFYTASASSPLQLLQNSKFIFC